MRTEVLKGEELADAELDAVHGGLTDMQKFGIGLALTGPFVWMCAGVALSYMAMSGDLK